MEEKDKFFYRVFLKKYEEKSMGNSWYKKSMLTVQTVKANIKDIANKIESIEGVKKIYAWGSFARNIKSKDYILRDLDIIVKTDFISGDLLSISEEPINLFNLKQSSLIEEGFNPRAISFTKEYLKFKDFNIDHWAISKDNKLLHWGPTLESKSDYDAIKKEAEFYADLTVGKDRFSLNSNQKKKRWLNEHDHHLEKYLEGMPDGWYLSSEKVKDILENTIIIS